MTKYEFTSKMREISGFGGDYEAETRKMVIAGLEWLDAHPDADPKITQYENVFGIVNAENADGQALSDAVGDACDDCSGAMHQKALQHIFYIRRFGWEKYVEEMESHD